MIKDMGLTALEEILEANLQHEFIEQGAIPSIKLCCRLFANQKDEGDLTFLKEMKQRLLNGEDYVETMINDWINELEKKLNDK